MKNNEKLKEKHPKIYKYLNIILNFTFNYFAYLFISITLTPFIMYGYELVGKNPIIKLPHIFEFRNLLLNGWFPIALYLIYFIVLIVIFLNKQYNKLKLILGLTFVVIFIYFFTGTLSLSMNKNTFINNFLMCYVALLPLIIMFFTWLAKNSFDKLMDFLKNDNSSKIVPERITIVWQIIAGIAIALWTIVNFFK